MLRRFLALNRLSFSIGEGKLIGFLGANGAGKTTILRMILDILRPTSRTIEVLGGPTGRAKAPENRIPARRAQPVSGA